MVGFVHLVEASMIEPWKHTQLLDGTLQNLFYPPEKDKYVYFERADEKRFDQAGSLRKAAWAMDASMLAYARYGAAPMGVGNIKECLKPTGLDYVEVGDWKKPGTQAIFARRPEFAILAFRGTEADDPDDLKLDINVLPRPESVHLPSLANAIRTLGHLGSVISLIKDPCLVHPGFRDALDQVWKQVQDLLNDYRKANQNSEICFTGHSLGGALAVLAFRRFADKNSSLYTFGCPRVGDATFRDQVLSNRGKGIFRYVNYNDAVTHIPSAGFAYQQTPDECRRFDAHGTLDTDDGSFKGDVESLKAAILSLPDTLAEVPGALELGKLSYPENPKSKLDLNKIDAPTSLVDHSPARYCFRLWDCVRVGE